MPFLYGRLRAMSTPATANQPAALQAARQQLDELGALLQRMLALPVVGGEDEALADWPAPEEAEFPPLARPPTPPVPPAATASTVTLNEQLTSFTGEKPAELATPEPSAEVT